MSDLEIKNLTVEYASAGYVVRPIDNLSIEASSGELVLLLGPSGCGKTTLLSCLAGILSPTSGTIHIDGKRVDDLHGDDLTFYRRHTVGIVFQAFNLVPSLTALENVAAPMLSARMSHRDARARAQALLERVGLAERAHHKPGDMSGGQQQRVAIARALAHDPPLLLADEPTAHLDYVQVESILHLVRELAQPGRLVVVATHDPRMVPLADRVIDLAPKIVSLDTGPRAFTYAAGEVVFEQGSRGDLIYIVEDGEIDIVRRRADGTDEVVAVIGRGEYFGELGPLLGFPRSATARAKTAARLTGYPVADFRELLHDDPKLAKLLGAAAKRSLEGSAPRRNGAGARKTAAPRKGSTRKATARSSSTRSVPKRNPAAARKR